jgi:hypothetical protein
MVSLEDIKAKIAEWKQKNKENPAEYDRVLLLENRTPPKSRGQ